MKVIVFCCPDTVDTAPFTMGANVTVTKDANTISGKVMFSPFQAPDPPSMEGVFTITKYTPPSP